MNVETIASASTTDGISGETEYVVLTREGERALWRFDKTIKARSADAAIRRFLNGQNPPDGTYVAVPARSWKPVVVKAETQTVLRLEEAK